MPTVISPDGSGPVVTSREGIGVDAYWLLGKDSCLISELAQFQIPGLKFGYYGDVYKDVPRVRELLAAMGWTWP